MSYTNPFNDMLKNTFDYNQFLTTGRRNLEAASEASQAIVESAQAISRRGAEIARESVEGAMKASKDIFTSGTPETNIAKQTEFAKTTFENSLSNFREMSEMVAKSCFEAFDVLTSRAAETIEEISKAAGTTTSTGKKKAA